LIKKGRDQSWTGTITKKVVNDTEDEDGHVSQIYSLNIHTDEGKDIKVGTAVKFYSEVKVGDRLKKEKGKSWPEKIS